MLDGPDLWPWVHLQGYFSVSTPEAPETFLSSVYGSPKELGTIVTVSDRRGRIVVETTSGITVILPIGGPQYAAHASHVEN